MLIFKADDISAQSIPQIARWIVGDKQYVIESDADWNDPRLPAVVQPDVAEEIPDVEIH